MVGPRVQSPPMGHMLREQFGISNPQSPNYLEGVLPVKVVPDWIPWLLIGLVEDKGSDGYYTVITIPDNMDFVGCYLHAAVYNGDGHGEEINLCYPEDRVYFNGTMPVSTANRFITFYGTQFTDVKLYSEFFLPRKSYIQVLYDFATSADDIQVRVMGYCRKW